jgi:DNA-directed RNA polymerase subunit RPC12/RpoP
MAGRHGADELTRFQSVLVLVLLILSMITKAGIFSLLALLVMIHMYFRVLSRNHVKRAEENQKYRSLRYKTIASWNKFKTRIRQRRDFRFYKCPTCRQQVRVPKGHGRIEITCPKCREHFIRKS